MVKNKDKKKGTPYGMPFRQQKIMKNNQIDEVYDKNQWNISEQLRQTL